MMGTELGNEQKGQPLAVGNSNTVVNSNVPAELDTLTVNVFFDGTNNNKYNTQARLNNQHTHLRNQDSYKNYFSNVALLNMAAKRIPKEVENIYIEGSGSFKYEEDSSLPGGAMSKGGSGAYARLAQAFEQVQKAFEASEKSRLQMNVFGFSRGSFYARFFCAMLKREPSQLLGGYGEYTNEYEYTGRAYFSKRKLLSLFPKDITINFVGIFDTVSSHGVFHDNDAEPFELDIGKKQGIRKIVHLTAQNEYREHFPLTRINTAAAEGIGYECSLPGAHADIGGSYNADEKEERYLSALSKDSAPIESGEIHWEWFKQMGYYQGVANSGLEFGGEFKVKGVHTGKDSFIFKVYANKSFNKNNYQFVALEIMRDIAIREAHISFTGNDKKNLEDDIASIEDGSDELKLFRAHAHPFIMTTSLANGLDYRVDANAALSQGARQKLYHDYIHNSLNLERTGFGTNKGNRYAATGQPQRLIINDNA